MGEESPFDHNAIDDVIHGRIRLGVVAYLSAVDFGLVRGAARQGRRHRRQPLGASEQARGRRLRRADKSFVNRKPQTRLSLTAAGRKAWAAWLTQMEALSRAAASTGR